MRNKNLFQEKITRLESAINTTNRAISLNDREQAFSSLDRAKEILSDMQSMLNREQEYFN